MYLGIAYLDSEQYPESIALFKDALKELPDFLNLHARLSASYVMAGMEDQARKQNPIGQ